MPCPHYSNDNGECLLGHDDEEDEDGREVSVEDPVALEWCLGSEKAYRECPVYRRFLAELIP